MARFYALASIETFKDFGASIGGSLVDRIRTNIGMGKRVTPALRIELSYLFHRIRLNEATRDFGLDDHVLRLRFFSLEVRLLALSTGEPVVDGYPILRGRHGQHEEQERRPRNDVRMKRVQRVREQVAK